MTSNKYTLHTKVYHSRQNAMGLCRSCPQPLSPDSKQLCERHLAKQRETMRRRWMLAGGRPNFLLRALIRAAFESCPGIPRRTVAAVLNCHESTVRDVQVGMGLAERTKDRRARLVEALRSDPTMPYSRVAEMTGYSATGIYAVAKALGFKPPVGKGRYVRQK